MEYDDGVDSHRAFDPAELDSSDSDDGFQKLDEKRGWFWCCDLIKKYHSTYKFIQTAMPIIAGVNFKAKW